MRTRAITRIRNRGGNDPRYTQERLQTRTQTVPEPNEENLLEVCKTLKEAVETLSGERGDIHNNGVSFADLEALDLITIKEANKDIQSNFVRTAEDWHEVGATGEPAFANSWVDHATANISPTGFYKDLYGRVYIRGGIKDGTTGTVAFTLPEEYRSGYRMNFAVINNSGVFAYINVEADGDIVPQTSDTDYVSLDGISFRAT